MIIKIKFSSGKEIELTLDEYNELMNRTSPSPQIVPITIIPYQYPGTFSFPTHPWDGTFVVTCSSLK